MEPRPQGVAPDAAQSPRALPLAGVPVVAPVSIQQALIARARSPDPTRLPVRAGPVPCAAIRPP